MWQMKSLFSLQIFVFVITCIAIAGCDAPGEGKTAEKGKAEGNHIVHALKAFKAEHPEFPSNLSELVPKYLERAPAPLGDFNSDVQFYYIPKGQDYRLGFHYFGPGSNTCIHDATEIETEWDCSGTN
jgi:hypothetical protein